MLNEFLWFMLGSAAFAIALMIVVWWTALGIENLGIVDIAWTFSFLPLALAFAFLARGDLHRRLLVAGLASLWSVRLGSHVALRVWRHHPKEDVRYRQLRVSWGPKLAGKTFCFFQFQALSIAALSSVFIVPCLNPQPGLNALEYAGGIVALVGICGEAIADLQLKAFGQRIENKGAICKAGLWHYSRHPNYFFEWLVWVGFFLVAWSSPGGCWTVFCPALMLYFLLRVTGIPLTEKLSVARKGEAYREYQRTTSAFVPWFPKQTHESR